MKKILLSFLLLINIVFSAYSQQEIKTNQTDYKGLKQGFWKGWLKDGKWIDYDENGSILKTTEFVKGLEK